MGIYLLASLLFVVSDFVEFALALSLNQYNEKKQVRRRKYSNKKKENMKVVLKKENEISTNCTGKPTFAQYTGKPTFNVRKIDRVSFVVASLLFFVFNVMYWISFLIL